MSVTPDASASGLDAPSRGAIVTTGAATAMILGCGIVSGLIAARSLGPTGRGELATITVWASVLLYAGTLGLPEAVAYFSAARGSDRERVWTTGQIAALALGLVITVAGWWLIPAIFAGRNATLVQSIRWYLVLFAIPGCASLCASAWLQGAGRLRAYNISRSSIHFINAGGAVVLLAAGDHSVAHFAAVTLIGNLAGWIVAAGYGPWKSAGAAPASTEIARRLFHYGFRVQVGNWSNAASVRLDQLLLSVFAPASSLGLYVVAVTYSNVLQTIPSSAAMVMLPEIVRQHEAGTAGACAERWYRRALWTTMLGAMVLAAIAVVLVPALFGSAFADAVPIVMVLVPATIILGMNQLLSTAFRGVGRPEIGSASELIGVVVTLVALGVLLPRYGAFGAAAASLAAYASSHVYLLRQARSILGGAPKSLYMLTRDDMSALRGAIYKRGSA